MSSAIGARVRPLSFGVSASEACSAPIEEKSSAVLRHCSSLDGLERMPFQRLHQLGLERRASPGGAEGAVARGTAGTAGDLRKLSRIELAKLIAVELAVGSKRHMVDVEIESHSDGVGGHNIFDIAGLVQRDLGIAGARRQRAQDHRSAAALAADQLGNRIDLLGRKRDDRRSSRKPRDLLFARE